ncbi:MAG: ATPase [Sphingobacteriales bacterium 41-5]|nr:MAG: ATPase [Sphingobacteriales bacterium 41-5]
MWFSKPNQDVLNELGTTIEKGLSPSEVQSRQEKYGPNQLQGKKKKTVFQLFIAQLKDWLIYVLMAAVIITALMGEYVDAVIIVLVIIINAVLGVIQEVKAGKAIEALKKMSSPKALVRRNGEAKEVDSATLVPGDIILLDAGRHVPADLRLVEAVNLQVEESALTGESVPTEKNANEVFDDPQTPLGDRLNSAFMSTLVTYGRGVGVVVATGMETEVGRIAKILDDEEDTQTPLERRLDDLGKMLGKIAIGICLFIFVLSLIQGRDIAEMFLVSVSLAVAAIPEGLAAIVAVVLSIGVTAMSKKNAIIKRLPAVETLGSVNVICSDKTGTLTQNRMTVVETFTTSGQTRVDGDATKNSTEADQFLTKAMILSSDATYENGEGTGDPTEIALLMLGDNLGIDRKELAQASHRENEHAFDSDRKLMSTLIETDNQYRVYSKGALGSLFDISTQVYDNGKSVPITDEHKDRFRKAAETMSDQALRTLAVGYKDVGGYIEAGEMESDITLLGIVGMIDPPREEVKESIRLAKEAGIITIMITGDHKNTAFAIAKGLGIAETIDQAIGGKEFDQFAGEQLAEKVKEYRVFARVSPEHKVKIVRGLKANGNIVSMTGDGVNDAPSLNAADIGVAMGITGTDVAKGAADMILTDDNFSTIVTAIEQGRNIYNNIKKSVIFLLTCNFGEVVTMFAALSIGWAAPLIATQILWINLITDSLPAIALGMDPGDPDVMKEEKPRDPKESFFAHGAGWHAVMGGLLIGCLTILAFWFGYYERGYSPFDKNVPEEVLKNARTLAFIVLIACQLFYSLSVRNVKKSVFKIGLFSNKYLIGAIVLGLVLQLGVMFIPFLRNAFGLVMLDSRGWTIAIIAGIVPFVLSEVMKLFRKA